MGRTPHLREAIPRTASRAHPVRTMRGAAAPRSILDAPRRLDIGMIAPPWLPVPPPAYGGIEVVVADLTRELARRGHRVRLLAAATSHVDGAEVRSVLEQTPSSIGNVCDDVGHALGAYDELVDADLVIDHTGPTGALLSAWSGPPTLHVCHGRIDGEQGELYRAIARRVPGLRLVAISDAQRRQRAELPFAGVCPNGIDVAATPFRAAHDGYLAFVGRMSPDKAPDAAIRIARAAGMPIRIAAKCREADERAYFEAHVRPLLGPDVDWLGELAGADVAKLMAGAAALVFPIAWPEPFGMVMIEAMACGTPVLAYPRGAAPEVVDHGVTGYLCRDEDDMAAAVGQLDRLDRAVCRAHVATRFSHVAMADAYETLAYATVRGGRARGDRAS